MSTPLPSAPNDTNPLGPGPEQGFTLPSHYYTDHAVFEREKEAIFYRTWQYVCHQSAVRDTGDYATKQIADENIFVIRRPDGELGAFYNVCRHRAHRLVEGTGNRSRIVCPYHAWGYSLTGELTHARNCEHVSGFDKSRFGLRSVPVEIFCGLVFVNLDPDAKPLSEMVPDLAHDLNARIPYINDLEVKQAAQFGGQSIAAGWKVVVDNYLECYHCPNAHLDFANIIDMSCYRMEVFGQWSRQLGPVTRHQNSAYEFSATDVQQNAGFWFLWPNTTFNILPGNANLGVLTMSPIDASTTSFVGHQLGLDDYQTDDARMDYLNNVLGPEDQRLCESVQKGLSSRSYNQGRFMVDAALSGGGEHAVYQFHRLVHEALS